MSQLDVAPAPSARMAPTRAEVQRRLSTRSKSSQPPPVATGQIASGNESDSSVASSSHLVGLGPGQLATPTTHFATSPVTSPVMAPHGGLSAIEEGQSSSLDMGADEVPNDLDLEDADDDSEEGTQAAKDDGVDSQRVYKSGFLIKKQERRTVGPAWKKKWFVLRPTRLAYYKDNREYSLLRAIELKEVHSVVPVTREKAKHPFSFAIVTAERTFFVEALSAEERDDWVRAINSVRKQMSDREDDTRRRDQAVAVPVPTQQQLQAEMDVETHQGTWTSTFSTTTAASASPTATGGSFFHRQAVPAPSAYQAPSQSAYQTPVQPSYQSPAPSAYQSPVTPRGQQPPRSPSPGTGNITTQMGGMSVGRSSSVSAPSAAAVNRRLSNPIVHPPNLQPPTRTLSHRRDTSGEAATLSPPPSGAFVSSDEEDMYFSDQPQWTDPQQQQQQQQQCGALGDPWVADPNKIIVATYLMKKSRKTTREVWRKRWFFLTSSGMTYSKSHMDTRPLAFVPITTILDVFSIEDADEVEEDDSSDDSKPGHHPTRRPSARRHREPPNGPQQEQHVIRIVTNKRRFDLCAPSEEEEIKWIAAIRALVNREREKRQPAAGPGGGAAATPAAGATGTAAPPGKIPLPLNVPTIAQQPPTPSSLPPASPTGSPQKTSAGATEPPLTPTHSFQPTHGRSRSATQTAKNAVADVVRRFHEGGGEHTHNQTQTHV